MHEISLIHGLLEMVAESALTHGIKQVDLVRLVVGQWYGTLPEALDFAFRFLTRGTVCDGAKLEIEITPGQELYLDYYEGE